MTEYAFKNSLGVLIVLAHFVMVITVIVLRYWCGMLNEEQYWTTLRIVGPMLGSYMSMVVAYFLSTNQIRLKQHPVNGTLAFISFLALFLTVGLVVGASWLRATQRVPFKFEAYRNMLVLAEALFGVSFGPIVLALFRNGHDSQQLGVTTQSASKNRRR